MGDGVFRELLTATAAVERPKVERDGDGAPRTPRYEELVVGVAVRLAPARTVSEDDLLGRNEAITLIAYLEPLDLRPGDRLVTRPVATVLSEDVAAGAAELPVADTTGLLEGQSVEVGAGDALEEHVVAAVGAGTLTLAAGLAREHAEGEAVRVVRRHEVIEVADEAGAGHHLRAVVRVL